MADAIKEFADAIALAVNDGHVLRIRGGGSKDFLGNPPRTDRAERVLDTRGHAGIVAYEPTELYVTARCGTPLAELEAALAAQGQMLAFEPPHFADNATVGGMVAAGVSGPRRATVGAVRDFVLGVRLMDGQGRQLKFGGEVMKNVAGYDVSRLLAGSFGTLGLMLDVSLKVLPRPAAEATLCFEMPEAAAVTAMNQWAGKPLPVSATAWVDDVLTVRLSGARAAVASACAQLGGETLDEAAARDFWIGLREQRLDYFSGEAPLWRIALPSATQPLGLPGAVLIEWGGAQRWLRGDPDAEHMRDVAAKAGGHARLFRGGDRLPNVFQQPAGALAALNHRVREAMDPEGVFDTGRL
jgi:glycolate oxidase FAD binding subunit